MPNQHGHSHIVDSQYTKKGGQKGYLYPKPLLYRLNLENIPLKIVTFLYRARL